MASAVGVNVGPPGVMVSVGVGVLAAGSVLVGVAVAAIEVGVMLAVDVAVCVGTLVWVGVAVRVGVLDGSGLVFVGVGVNCVQTEGVPEHCQPGST